MKREEKVNIRLADRFPHQTEGQYLAGIKKSLVVRPFFTILGKIKIICKEIEMDPQAKTLNETLAGENPCLLELLSEAGLALFFPKLGILSQSAEAAGKRINATIGIALEENGQPLYLQTVHKYLGPTAAQRGLSVRAQPREKGTARNLEEDAV